MTDITNYVQLTRTRATHECERWTDVATSGQPTREQFAEIAARGYRMDDVWKRFLALTPGEIGAWPGR